MMTTSRQQLIATLEKTQLALVQTTSGLSNEALDFRATSDDWTIREILAHLVDDEMYVMRLRLERIVKEDAPHLTPHDEKKWYANRNTTRDKLAELLADFELQRSASLAMIKMLREEDWQRQGFQPEYGQFNGEEWLGRWVEHDTVHIQQITNTLESYRNSKSLTNK